LIISTTSFTLKTLGDTIHDSDDKSYNLITSSICDTHPEILKINIGDSNTSHTCINGQLNITDNKVTLDSENSNNSSGNLL